MRIQEEQLSKIKYNTVDYKQSLYDSIMRIGFSFPISVVETDDGLECVDGHKRLSALRQILEDQPNYKRKDIVKYIVKNNGNSRSNDCWRSRNTH